MADTTRQKHINFLKEKIFQTERKWPQFNQMIIDIDNISKECNEETNIGILERAYIYGGSSLFSPLFEKGNITVVDCQTLSAEERGSYQSSWTDDERCIHQKANIIAPIVSTTLEDNSLDVLIIPNVVHHVRDQDAMFKEFNRILKPLGKGYIFEALIRELHQSPDDYVRYTPWGFEYMLEKSELKLTKYTPTGSAFEAISYCWIQALQYFPEEIRKEKEDWFYNEYFPKLLELDVKHPDNLFRKYTSFPTAYGIFFTK